MPRDAYTGFLSVPCVGVMFVLMAGCGLVRVNVNGEPKGGGSARGPAWHAAKRGATPQAASQSSPQVAPAPVAPGHVAQYDPAAQAERDRIVAEQELKARGMTVGDQLDAYTAESSKIRRFDDPFTLASWLMVKQKMGFLGLWITSKDGAAFRETLSPEERTAFDAKVKRAVSEMERLDAITPRGRGGSGTMASTSSDRSPSSSGDDSAARRSACLSSCQRSCPSPSGSGDQWAQSNAAYSQCQNEVSSCRLGCP